MLLCDMCQNYNTSPFILPVADTHLILFNYQLLHGFLNDFFPLKYKINQVSMHLILGSKIENRCKCNKPLLGDFF